MNRRKENTNILEQQKELQFHQQQEATEVEIEAGVERQEQEQTFNKKDFYGEIDEYIRLIIKVKDTMNKTKEIDVKGASKMVAIG